MKEAWLFLEAIVASMIGNYVSKLADDVDVVKLLVK